LEQTSVLGYEGQFQFCKDFFHEIPKREQLALFKFSNRFPSALNIQNYLHKKLLFLYSNYLQRFDLVSRLD